MIPFQKGTNTSQVIFVTYITGTRIFLLHVCLHSGNTCRIMDFIYNYKPYPEITASSTPSVRPEQRTGRSRLVGIWACHRHST